MKVTPYVGVWIETTLYASFGVRLRSLLMWECGLKHSFICGYEVGNVSLLMWECGLKLVQAHNVGGNEEVTPYVGVWIETLSNTLSPIAIACHSLCGSVD